MKKNIVKSLILIFIITLIFSVGSGVNALDYIKCGSSHGIPKPVPVVTTTLFTTLLVFAPIIFIVFSVKSLIATVATGNAEAMAKAKGKLIKRIIIVAIIFLVSFFIQLII